MAINYADRKIFWGNELLVVADLVKGVDGAVTGENVQLVTGLVSVGEMEDQAETNNYPADDVPDHGQKKGATLLQGEITFIQVDQTVRQELLGEQKTANGLGYSPTGNYKTKCVQYLHKATKRSAVDGTVEEGYMITLYPNLTATGNATKESETDSVDGVDPIQWTVPVQATASDKYLNNGVKVPSIEYEIWGEQAKAFMAKMEESLFIMFPDTVIEGGVVVPDAPTNAVGKFETNGDITVTFDKVTINGTDAGAYLTHYGDANQTNPTDLTKMGYTEGTTWTLKASDVPALEVGDTINIQVQAYKEKGVGATDVEKARYLHDGEFTGSAWSLPPIQLTKEA